MPDDRINSGLSVSLSLLFFYLIYYISMFCFYTMLSFCSTPGSKVLKLSLLYRLVVHVYGPEKELLAFNCTIKAV